MHVTSRGTGTALVLLHGVQVDHRLPLPLDPRLTAALLTDWLARMHGSVAD